jgi:hypothetical protein
MPSPPSDNQRIEPLMARLMNADTFLRGQSWLEVTDPDDLVGDEPKLAVGALGSVLQDGNGLIWGAPVSGHQDALSEANSVLGDDCLRQIVTRIDIVDCQARTPCELFSYVGLISESAAPM